MKRLVVPFGFYGFGNTGDEATLNGFARLMAHVDPEARVSVCSRDPEHTARVEPALEYFGCSRVDARRWIAKLRASAHLFAGGTPIQDVLGSWPLGEVAPLVRATEFWRVPIAFVGVGVESLRSEWAQRVFAREIIPRVRHWSVRSDKDRQRLTAAGAAAGAITVAADMAWLIESVPEAFGRQTLSRLGVAPDSLLIAVNVVNENGFFDAQPRVVQELAAAIDQMVVDFDAVPVFVAQEVRTDPTFDTAAARRVISQMRHGARAVLVPNTYFSPRQLMSIIGCCRLSLSMRYHFCLMSALQGIPFVAIERTDKLADLCWDLEWPAAVSPLRVERQVLLEHARGLMQDPRARGEHLSERARHMRQRAMRNVEALVALH